MCDLSDLVTIVDTLQQLSAQFYGPRCAQTLLTSNTGKAVVTSDGLTILESVCLSHPIADMIVSSLKKCHTFTYDGSKSFLLYLKFLLKHLTTSLQMGKFSGPGINLTYTDSPFYKHSKISAAKSINDILLNYISDIFVQLQHHPSCKEHRPGNLTDIMRSVCQATLHPHFNARVCKYFAGILTGIISGSDNTETMKNILQFEIVKFNQLIVKVPGRNYSDCTLFEPFLLKRSKHFTNFNGKGPHEPCVRAICLQLSSEDMEDDTQDIGMMIKDMSQIHVSLVVKRKAVDKFSKKCVGAGTTLIVCCDSLPEYAIHIFHEHKLSVLSNVLKEDIDMLELYTHTTSVVSFMDDIEEINVFTLTGVEEVTIGSEKFLHLKSDSFCFKHVVVCAPSPGLCDNTALLLQKALNALYISLESSSATEVALHTHQDLDDRHAQNMKTCSPRTENCFNAQITDIIGQGSNGIETLKVIPAGGSFEVVMSKLLINKSETITDPQSREICIILSETLLDVFKMLHENINAGRSQRNSRFINLKTEVFERLDEGKLVSLNIHGKICGEDDEVFFEPLLTKIHVLESVLNLTVQMLRIDNVIPVKRQSSG